ncbi:hypothetical protein D9Q98_005567 [Chlorella vulgaris]|uniref:Uncharacterized protein n=1 Tax=Chlorella vulgaris TaxID=3077 RepID=A0A9D4TM26_CHLVU|nr:hypothetical protein D9Q98_005567 [Chlorella vulgaris]
MQPTLACSCSSNTTPLRSGAAAGLPSGDPPKPCTPKPLKAVAEPVLSDSLSLLITAAAEEEEAVVERLAAGKAGIGTKGGSRMREGKGGGGEGGAGGGVAGAAVAVWEAPELALAAEADDNEEEEEVVEAEEEEEEKEADALELPDEEPLALEETDEEVVAEAVPPLLLLWLLLWLLLLLPVGSPKFQPCTTVGPCCLLQTCNGAAGKASRL